MCCIFTCCGWMIDLVQRLWTFTMACCISSAVCCALVTASMSGIALGYNYSLAEYIDLKETNVSVYLKRGIFDDEIGDDMDWRRSGHQPVAGHIGEGNLRTGAPEDESTTIRSGRRLDDSIYESDDRNKFEGSLMRLTAKAPAPSSTDQTETPVDADEVLSKYTMDSLDQMKAIQGMINMRKSADPRLRISKEGTKTTPPFVDERYLPHGPLNRDYIAPGRKHMPVYDPKGYNTPGDSARYAVPGEPINEPAKWYRPRLKTEDFVLNKHGDFDARATYPAPVTIREGPVRPSRPKPRPKPTLTAPPPTTLLRPEPNYPKSIDEDMDTFKDKILLDKFNSPSFNQEDFEKHIKAHKPDEDYEDAIKGIPSRKKRHAGNFETPNNSEKQISPLGPVPNKTMNVNSNESLFNKLRKSLSDIMSIDRNNNVTSSTIQHENNTSTILPSISNSMSSNIVLRLLKSTTT